MQFRVSGSRTKFRCRSLRAYRSDATGRCNKINLYWEYVLQYKRICLNKVKNNNDIHLVVWFRQCSASPQGSGGAGGELSAGPRLEFTVRDTAVSAAFCSTIEPPVEDCTLPYPHEASTSSLILTTRVVSIIFSSLFQFYESLSNVWTLCYYN